jgi:hypothetical protein
VDQIRNAYKIFAGKSEKKSARDETNNDIHFILFSVISTL